MPTDLAREITPIVALSETEQPITKLIVAVHGIGDQFQYATIQAVAQQIAGYCKASMPFPLGAFHPEHNKISALAFAAPEAFRGELGGIGFAEVFWADIHHQAQDTENTIEESKAWAQSMVIRMKGFDESAKAAKGDVSNPAVNYDLTSTVVAEMIETIGVLENLFFVAAKAGLPKFRLRKLLDDYLGAVQLVAEFVDYRSDILDRFFALMDGLVPADSSVEEIHIVAHSEGTAVTFYGLLCAMAGLLPEKYQSPWIQKVRGYMTFGSPIDKHIVMWPEMWKRLHGATPIVKPAQAITWWNYYDEGDPVGFKLETARAWLIDHGWIVASGERKPDGTAIPAAKERQPCFDFPEDHDVGFTRYPLPGKAHIDYWADADVFGHFISNVVIPKCTTPMGRPETKHVMWLASLAVPYLICFLLLCGGTYTLIKTLHPFLDIPVPEEIVSAKARLPGTGQGQEEEAAAQAWVAADEERIGFVAGSVVGIAALLGGVTMMSRVPRLVRPGWWWALAAGVFVIGALIYAAAVPLALHERLHDCFVLGSFDPGGLVIIEIAAVIAILSGAVSRLKPGWGMKPLICLGLLATLRIAWVRVAGVDKPLWPVVLGGAAFLYLWWLSALIFDLTFVWHRYIRGNETQRILKEVRRKRRVAAGEIAPLKTQPA